MVAEQPFRSTLDGEHPSDLLVEEWNLLSRVYKNAIDSRRAAWRVITSVEQKEKFKGKEQLISHAREYVAKVEGELQKIRDGILALMDKNLIPSSNTDELKMSYYKMKGDYYRCLAEFATGEAKSKAGEDACVAYAKATKIAEKDLVMTHPVRLAMALSSLDDVSVVAQRQIFMDQTVQKTLETPQLQRTDTVIEHVPPFQVRNTSYRDEVTSQATEKKEDLEADTAKHSSVLETAVSRSTLDGEVLSRDRIPQHTMEQTLSIPMPEMVTQSVEVPKTISQNRIQQRTMKQIVDDPVVQIVQIPQVHVVEKTDEIPVMTQRHISQDRIQQRTVEQIVDAPVPQTVKELTEVSKVFSQDRIQQRVVEQTIEDPAIPLVEKTVEMPVIRKKEKTQHVVNTHVQHVVNTVEVERSKLIKETQHRKKPIINEKINQMTKHIKIPQVQFLNKVDDMLVDVQQQIRPMTQTVQKTTEIPQLQFPDQVVDVPVMVQRQVSSIETVQKTVEVPQTQSIVKELRSKFEVGHTSEVPRQLRSVQKTVEVPRVQYIDKVADIPVDMQRQVSTTQAAQDIEEVEDVPALTQSEVPNITDDDEDWLEQESKKRKLPMPADAVSESRADESDFDRFDDLVLPSPEGKTLFVSIASGDEAEDESDKEHEMTRSLVQGGESMLVDETDAQAPERELVQAVHDVASDMSDVKNELAHVREMVGVLVRRERSAEHKAEAATRRLDRMEREQTEADDAEHEANLQEALANQSKAVKVLVDKWFVDKGYGFGKAPTGEIVFIHASAVQGAEVLTIGTDAWVQVVNDDARAQGGYRAKRAWGRNAWKAERDKENANKVAQQVRRAAALTAELAAQSEKKTAAVCDQPPGLDELAGHIEAPNMGAGGSHPQATMMPDPWATYKCPSAEEGQPANNAPPETTNCVPANQGTFALAKRFHGARSRSATRNVETRNMVDEALDFYEKANGRDRTQKRQELENMRPGELRRSLERWQAHAEEVQRLQEKKEHAWDLYSRVPNFRRMKKEDFERDFAHKVVYSGKVDEKRLQEWTDEMQSKVQRAERELEARERKWMESEDSNSQRRRAWEKLWQPGTFSSLSYFSSLQR